MRSDDDDEIVLSIQEEIYLSASFQYFFLDNQRTHHYVARKYLCVYAKVTEKGMCGSVW